MSIPDRHRLERLRQALASLPEPLAQVYRRHAVEGEDYASIAEAIGISVATVERSFAEAIVLLDQALRGGEGGRS